MRHDHAAGVDATMKISIRTIVLFVFIALSFWYILSPLIFQPSGVIVVSVEDSSKCTPKSGDSITYIEGAIIKNSADFERLTAHVKKGDRVTMVVNNGPGGCTALADGDVGVKVKDALSAGIIKFGTDISGGDEVWLNVVNASDSELTRVKDMLVKRAGNIKGSKISIDVIGENIVVEASNLDHINDLIIPGYVKGKIEWSIKLSNSTGELRVGKISYEVFSDGNKLTLINKSYSIGDSLSIENITFSIANVTNSSLEISSVIFENHDILKIFKDMSYTKYDSTSRSYYFYLPVEISSAAGERFNKIASGLPTVFIGQNRVLDGMLVFSIDNKELSRLTIPINLVGENITSLSIVGRGEKIDSVNSDKALVEMALDGGRIEDAISIFKIEKFEGEFEWLVFYAMLSILALVGVFFAIAIVVLKNVKIVTRLKVGIYGVLFLLVEVVCLFGGAALSQTVFSPGWILDIPSITGILLMLSISSAQMLYLTRKSSQKNKTGKIYNYLVLALVLAGFVLMFTQLSGAGIALVSGLLFGILITKPLYKKILSANA